MGERKRSLAFDRVADCYDATRGGDSRGIVVSEALRPLLPAGRLLEIGVGTGVVAAALRAAGLDVVGVDLSGPMLARAQRRLGPRIVQADAQALPVADGAVAAVYAVWVLHLVADVRAVLAECVRVTRPGGRVLIVTGRSARNAGTDVEELVTEMWQRLRPGGRVDRPEVIVALAEGAGLRCVHRSEFWGGAYPLSPAELARRITERSYSVLWEISDEVWQAEIPPLLDRINALPEPSRQRPTGAQYDLLTFGR